MRKLLRRQEGFTLLELLIVIVIIGILALIIVPGLQSGPKRARDAQRKSDLRAVKNALETYYNDNNGYPYSANYSGLAGHLVTAYIPALPDDPKNTDPYVYNYIVVSGCTASPCASWTMQAHMENTKDKDIKTGTTDTYEVTSVNQ